MNSRLGTILGAIVLVMATAVGAGATNSIVVESRNFEVGQSACSLGIWLTNDVEITGLVLMLEARSLSGGAFFTGGNPLTRPNRQAGMRLDASPLGSADPGGNWPTASTTNARFDNPAANNTCSGPVSNTYSTAVGSTSGTSPDAWMFSCVSSGNPGGPDFDSIALAPGADPPTRDSASWIFIFDANSGTGCFEIDTCCRTPSGHTSLLGRNLNNVPVEFVKGSVCLASDVNLAPTINCPELVTQPKDPGENGAVVNYSVTYFDEDTTLVPICSPPSGSFFPVGVTVVTCTVTDTFGLADTCAFTVTVYDFEGNSIVIESRTFDPAQSACTLGVWLTNDVHVSGLVFPFEARSMTGGAFYTAMSTHPLIRNPGRRLDNSPLGSADPGGAWPAASVTRRRHELPAEQTCSGPTANSYQTSVGSLSGQSPDGFLYSAVTTGDGNIGQDIDLDPGADPLVRDSASWIFVFDANGSPGCFELDTCCILPSGHIAMVDVNTNLVEMDFTKGVVCIAGTPVNLPPSITCPGNIQQQAPKDDSGKVVTYSVGVVDEDPSLVPDCNPPSGSFFPVGTTPVTCIATDTAGLADTCTFTITILPPPPNQRPVLHCPPQVAQSIPDGEAGGVVTFTVPVSDDGPPLTPVCTPPSGSYFPYGSSTVTCIVTDAEGLADTCTIEVIVHYPAANAVIVESKTFTPGQTACSVGVFISNAVPIPGIVLIFELRTIDGAYFKGPVGSSFFNRQPGNRVDQSPLGSAGDSEWPPAHTTKRLFSNPVINTCSGPISHTWGSAQAMVGPISPDAVEFAAVSSGDPDAGEPISLLPGADVMTTSQASFVFAFDVDTVEGCFEIDTACTTPANHLSFVDENTSLIVPTFTRGVVCITNCACNCHANPAVCYDSGVNILDVLYTVNVAFRGYAEINDDNPLCPHRATDVNCDGVSSVIDVIKMVDVAFRAGDPAAVFCDPCE